MTLVLIVCAIFAAIYLWTWREILSYFRHRRAVEATMDRIHDYHA